MNNKRTFSLKVYVLVVCALTWPFQFAYMIFGPSMRPILLISMIMVAVASYICGKYIFKDGFENAGWSWGKPRHYVMAFGLAVFLWLVPSILERVTGIFVPKSVVSPVELGIGFILNFFTTLIPAFGEEFGWRGYMLPRLLKLYSVRKALLIHGFVTWFWHLPVLIVMGQEIGGNPLISIFGLLLISIIPTVMHAIVFAYIWSTSASLAVATVYHSAFDEIRDTIQGKIGFGPLVEPWQIITLTLLGIFLLFKSKWKFQFKNV